MLQHGGPLPSLSRHACRKLVGRRMPRVDFQNLVQVLQGLIARPPRPGQQGFRQDKQRLETGRITVLRDHLNERQQFSPRLLWAACSEVKLRHHQARAGSSGRIRRHPNDLQPGTHQGVQRNRINRTPLQVDEARALTQVQQA